MKMKYLSWIFQSWNIERILSTFFWEHSCNFAQLHVLARDSCPRHTRLHWTSPDPATNLGLAGPRGGRRSEGWRPRLLGLCFGLVRGRRSRTITNFFKSSSFSSTSLFRRKRYLVHLNPPQEDSSNNSLILAFLSVPFSFWGFYWLIETEPAIFQKNSKKKWTPMLHFCAFNDDFDFDQRKLSGWDHRIQEKNLAWQGQSSL